MDSDVDLLAEFGLEARISLAGMASLRTELSDLLGAAADLVERSTLRSVVREAAEQEAVRPVTRRGARERLENIRAAAQDALGFYGGLDNGRQRVEFYLVHLEEQHAARPGRALVGVVEGVVVGEGKSVGGREIGQVKRTRLGVVGQFETRRIKS